MKKATLKLSLSRETVQSLTQYIPGDPIPVTLSVRVWC